MGRPITRRRAEQAAQQKAYRVQQTALRKPSRDDVARVALHLMITEALSVGDAGLGSWCEHIVKILVAQGFERSAAHRRLEQLVELYADGWQAQRKPHLTRPKTDGPPESWTVPPITPANGVDM
jgi:hypothetical protein